MRARFYVCVCVLACVCACFLWGGGNVEFNKKEEIQLYWQNKIKERNLSRSVFCGSFDRVRWCFLLFDCDFYGCCFVYMRIVNLKYRYKAIRERVSFRVNPLFSNVSHYGYFKMNRFWIFMKWEKKYQPEFLILLHHVILPIQHPTVVIHNQQSEIPLQLKENFYVI